MGIRRFFKNVKGYFSSGLWGPISGSRANGGNRWRGSYDVWGSEPEPSVVELLASCEDVVYACAELVSNNVAQALACPKLCVPKRTGHDLPVKTKALDFRSKQYVTKSFRQFARKGDAVEEVVEHSLLDLLENPNPIWDFRKLIRVTELMLELCGQAYWYLDIEENERRPDNGHVREIWLLPSQNITAERDEDTGLIKQYWNSASNERVAIPPAKIIHFQFDNPLDVYCGGMSPVRAVWQRVQLMRKEQSSWEAILNNAAFPSALIFPKNDDTFHSKEYTERQAKELEARFRQGKGGGVWAVNEAITYQPVSTPPKDLSALQIFDQLKTSICNAYGVPRPCLDMLDSNFASAEVAERSLQLRCLNPRITMILETLNKHLVPRYGPNLFLVCSEPIQLDKAFNLQEELGKVQAGIWLVNEIRARDGLEPVDYGNKPLQLQSGPQGTQPALTLGVYGLDQKVTDESGHEHASDGRFGSGGRGGHSGGSSAGTSAVLGKHDESKSHASKILSAAVKVPAKALKKGRELAGKVMKKVESRYGPKVSKAVQIGVTLAMPVPVPGMSAIVAGSIIAIAELHRQLLGKDADGADIDADELKKLVADTLKELFGDKLPDGVNPEAAFKEDDDDSKAVEATDEIQSKPATRGTGLIAAELQRLYADLHAYVLDSVQDHFTKGKTPTVKAFIPQDDWQAEMKERLTPILRVLYSQSSKDFIAEIGKDTEIPVLPIEKLSEAVNRLVLDLAQSTLSTTTEDVTKAIEDLKGQLESGLDSGEANNQLTARVNEIFAGLSSERAYLIADTEATRIKHDAELMTAKESGLNMKKVWLPDALACPRCAKLNGVKKGLDEPFLVDGTGAYSVIDAPPRHPGCRCSMTYEIEDD